MSITFGAGLAPAQQENALVVLANRNVPESLELARYYMEQRDIPSDHLCVLDVPHTESISRSVYEASIRDPLIKFMSDRGLVSVEPREEDQVGPHETRWRVEYSEVGYLVSIYGIPLRIDDLKPALARKIASQVGRQGKANMAAVDSELAVLLSPPYEIDGPVKNPLYRTMTRSEAGQAGRSVLITSRLDGPTAEGVRRRLDDTLKAERYGLQGRAYFDIRGIRDPGYIAGDHWIKRAFHRMAQEGYDCVMEEAGRLFDQVYPMEDAAFYLGWYTEHVEGPFLQEDFVFNPGAVAYHIHSASAITLRSTDRQWAGPLLARGAAGTLGAVGEPYLHLSLDLDIFTDRLCTGFTFGESAYMALPALSWQMTVVGDPLYKPFRFSLQEQIQHLEQDGAPGLEWAYVRRINELIRGGRFNVALDLCREKQKALGSEVLQEKLADLYAINLLYDEAFTEYRALLDRTHSPRTAIRVGARALLLLRMLQRMEEAQKMESELRTAWAGNPLLDWLDTAHP